MEKININNYSTKDLKGFIKGEYRVIKRIEHLTFVKPTYTVEEMVGAVENRLLRIKELQAMIAENEYLDSIGA